MMAVRALRVSQLAAFNYPAFGIMNAPQIQIQIRQTCCRRARSVLAERHCPRAAAGCVALGRARGQCARGWRGVGRWQRVPHPPPRESLPRRTERARRAQQRRR